jgi:xylose isomerase
LEPKPNEPRGDILLPTLGHEEMAGLNFAHGISQALWHDKLFDVDLNGQHGPRFDQDLRFCAGNLRGAFWDRRRPARPRDRTRIPGLRSLRLQATARRGDRRVWESARACMRNYLILRDKAQAFRSDPEVVEALDRAKVAELRRPALEALDQLAMEHLLGVR